MANTSSHTLTAGTDPRPLPGLLQRFGFALTLRSYGNNLLTRAGRSYLFTMSFLMLVVSLAEGVSWGYFGTQISDYPWISGTGMGLVIFLFMWFFDRSLMTADYMQDEHGATLQGKPHAVAAPDAGMAGKLLYVLATNKAFVFRIAIAAASLVIVAPYVSELAFYGEIQNKQRDYFQQEIKTIKQAVIDEKKAALAALGQRLALVNSKYQDEVSGKLTGFRGRGDAAKAIERELDELQQQYRQQQTALANYTKRVEQAVEQHNLPEMAALGISVNQDSSVLRKKAVNDIKAQHPAEYWQVEITIRVLLAIFAAGLFSMKIMQPRHVKLYFSSLLQQQWNLYCLGKYDACLPATERRDFILKSQDAVPEEFERIIVAYMQDISARHQREQALADQEKAASDAIAREQQEQEQAELARQAALDAEARRLSESESAHIQRLAEQKALSERRELERRFFEQQIEQSLTEIDALEQSYLQHHSDTIEALKAQETALVNEAHELEKAFKTHQERIEARNQRIIHGEQECREIQQLLAQTRQRPDNDSIEVLRIIADAENALCSQNERLERQRAELLGFEANQKFYQENNRLLSQRLNDVQQQLHDRQQPLLAVGKARAAIESRRVEFLLEQGLQDSPYLEHSTEEMPHLVEKLRSQLQQSSPSTFQPVNDAA